MGERIDVYRLIESRITLHLKTMSDERNEPTLRYMAAGAFEALRELQAALTPSTEEKRG
jgi:hypothetical protein